ncbi:MAG: hypothetical protein EBR54_09695 [Flavobacteriia bacterium]|nr:hypothetical protein [Flavobacteriia bacterium]
MLKVFVIPSLLLLNGSGYSQTAPSTSNLIAPLNAQDSLSKSLEVLAEAAASWTPEQKKEFADVFFIERGKFTIPKEPIVLKHFKKDE